PKCEAPRRELLATVHFRRSLGFLSLFRYLQLPRPTKILLTASLGRDKGRRGTYRGRNGVVLLNRSPQCSGRFNTPIRAKVSSTSSSAKTLGGRRRSLFWRIRCSWVEASCVGTECFAYGKGTSRNPSF